MFAILLTWLSILQPFSITVEGSFLFYTTRKQTRDTTLSSIDTWRKANVNFLPLLSNNANDGNDFTTATATATSTLEMKVTHETKKKSTTSTNNDDDDDDDDDDSLFDKIRHETNIKFPIRASKPIQIWNKRLDRLIKTDHPNAARYAHEILNYLLQIDGKNHNHPKPDLFTFNTIFSAYASRGDSSHIDSLLSEMKSVGIEPDTITYNTILHTYAKTQSATEANTLLDEMIQNDQADVMSFNTVIDAYAKSNSPHLAHQLLQRLETLYEMTSQNPKLKPTIVTYGSVIDAYAKEQPPTFQSAQHAEKIVKEMHQRYKSNRSANLKPNARVFNAVLNAWAQASSRYETAAKRADLMLQFMEEMAESMTDYRDIKPNSYSYNTVLKAWANSREDGAEEMAKRLLERMERQYRETRDETIKPDVVSYNTVLAAYANTGDVSDAENLFRKLTQRNNNNDDDDDVLPNAWTYTSLINVYARSRQRNAAQRATDILHQMKQPSKNNISPTTAAYNAVMNAWVKSGEWNAAQRVEALLGEMEVSQRQNPNVKPNVISYTTYVDALAKSRDEKDAPARAGEIVQHMEHLSQSDPSLTPTVYTYTSLINAIARSSHERHKAKKAWDVLLHVKQLRNNTTDVAKPNTFTYNAILNACAYTPYEEEYHDAFRIACLAFDDLRKTPDLKPNHVTYGIFLQICAKYMPKNNARRTMVEAIFRKCCADGQVGELVLDKLRVAAPPDLYRELLKGVASTGYVPPKDVRFVRPKDLPEEWSCNVRERRKG